MRRIAPLLALCSALGAQDTPRPNRVVWNAIFPEPMPDGATSLTLEGTSQFLRPDRRVSADGRTHAALDGEEWQLTLDWGRQLGPGKLTLRLRAVNRSGGFADQAFASFHTLTGAPQGGREVAQKYQLDYYLERDGVVVAELHHPKTQLMDTDLGYVVDLGDRTQGARAGLSVQLPTGKRADFSGSGGTDGMAGLATWTTWEALRFSAQVERVFLGLPASSPYRLVLDRTAFVRAWLGAGFQGMDPGFWGGLGVNLSLSYSQTPYRVGLPRVDRDGWQQHWTFTHHALPRWRFGLSEEAGTYHAPDLTVFATYSWRR